MILLLIVEPNRFRDTPDLRFTVTCMFDELMLSYTLGAWRLFHIYSILHYSRGLKRLVL